MGRDLRWNRGWWFTWEPVLHGEHGDEAGNRWQPNDANDAPRSGFSSRHTVQVVAQNHTAVTQTCCEPWAIHAQGIHISVAAPASSPKSRPKKGKAAAEAMAFDQVAAEGRRGPGPRA